VITVWKLDVAAEIEASEFDSAQHCVDLVVVQDLCSFALKQTTYRMLEEHQQHSVVSNNHTISQSNKRRTTSEFLEFIYLHNHQQLVKIEVLCC
jgi:hypothetical protein